MSRSTANKKKTIRDLWNGKDVEPNIIEGLMREHLSKEELEVVVWMLAREYDTFNETKYGKPYALIVKGIYDVLNNYLESANKVEELSDDEPDTSEFK